MCPFNAEKERIVDSWRSYLRSIEACINRIEGEINEATNAGACTGKMCRNAENMVNELENCLESFGQYPWRNKEDDHYICKLKQLLNDLYSVVYTASQIS